MDLLNPRPAGISVISEGASIRYVRRWYSSTVWLVLAFCVFWDAFLVFWYMTALSSAHPHPMQILFPLMHVGVGVFLTYRAITGFFNRSEISISGGKLAIHHGPFPWPGGKTLDVRTITQLYCDEKRRVNDGRHNSFYRLNAVLSDGSATTLLAAGLERDQALYLERELELRLGIENSAVVGELGKVIAL